MKIRKWQFSPISGGYWQNEYDISNDELKSLIKEAVREELKDIIEELKGTDRKRK